MQWGRGEEDNGTSPSRRIIWHRTPDGPAARVDPVPGDACARRIIWRKSPDRPAHRTGAGPIRHPSGGSLLPLTRRRRTIRRIPPDDPAPGASTSSTARAPLKRRVPDHPAPWARPSGDCQTVRHGKHRMTGALPASRKRAAAHVIHLATYLFAHLLYNRTKSSVLGLDLI